jgi:dTDP-4-amino-4,6-dideoxygalactose transaminase
MIRFSDVSYINQMLASEFQAVLRDTIDRGVFVLGSPVNDFENEFARYCQADFCVGVASGLDALTLSLKGFGIGPGDEVIVPSHTFIATWLAVTHVGARPVCCDVNDDTFNLNADSLDQVVSARTRAVIVVDLYGSPADVEAIVKWARPKGILVIEDAAQAHGALVNGVPLGHRADATAWSFYPGKNLGALGDGGAITTNNEDLFAQLLLLRNYGSRQRYIHKIRGFNSRLDSVQASFLRVKLPHLSDWVSYRRGLDSLYRSELINTPLCFQRVLTESKSAHHLFVVRTPLRDMLLSFLLGFGIETLIHYPTPPYKQDAYFGALDVNRSFQDKADRIANEVLSLPLGIHLSPDDIKLISSKISEFFQLHSNKI